MPRKPIASYLKGVLDVFWYLASGSSAILTGLLVWSLIAGPPAVSSFALEIGLGGFNFERAAGDLESNLTLALPVALESGQPEMKNLQADFLFPIHKGRFFSLSLAVMLSLMLLAVWTFHQLREIFGTLERRNPFDARNATRIRRIGIGFILMDLVYSGGVLFWSYSAGELIAANGARFVPATGVNASTIIFGLLILALSEVFREGARLREEQSLTI